MWPKLIRFLKGEQRPVTLSVPNAILGTLDYSKVDECWMTAENSAISVRMIMRLVDFFTLTSPLKV